MKKLISILILSSFFIACQDVIEVDLQTAAPRLVIDASLNWYKGTTGNSQHIKLTLSAPYFDKSIPPATGANVSVTDSNNNIFNFIEEGQTGIYKNNSFIPALNEVYNLTILYNDEVYKASETLISVANIDYVEQKNDGGFAGDEIEIKAFYSDPEGFENYYLFEFTKSNSNTINLEVYDDEFTDGNQIFGFYADEDLIADDELIIRNYGISKRYFNFMTILLQQSDEQSGDPFETQPAVLRGNCINETNPNNYPFGYFRASEVDEITYIIE